MEVVDASHGRAFLKCIRDSRTCITLVRSPLVRDSSHYIGVSSVILHVRPDLRRLFIVMTRDPGRCRSVVTQARQGITPRQAFSRCFATELFAVYRVCRSTRIALQMVPVHRCTIDLSSQGDSHSRKISWTNHCTSSKHCPNRA